MLQEKALGFDQESENKSTRNTIVHFTIYRLLRQLALYKKQVETILTCNESLIKQTSGKTAGTR